MSTLHDIATKTVAAWDAGDEQYLRLLMELLRHALEQQEEQRAVSADILDFEARGYLTALTFWHHLPEEDSDELAAFFVNFLRERKKPIVKVIRAAAPAPQVQQKGDAL